MKAFWSIPSILMVVLLILVSCGPKAAPAPVTPVAPVPAASVPAPVPTLTPATTPVTTAEKPKYGGTLNVIQSADINVFAPAVVPLGIQLSGYVYEQFTIPADWTKGKAGTGEIDWGDAIGEWKDVKGLLAESFETPEIGTWVMNMRKGVHWALDPNSEASRLVNGREMTADDAVFSVRYMMTAPTSRTLSARPALAKSATIEKTGPWQVTLRTPVDPLEGYHWILGGGAVQYIWAPEVVEKYGKTNDWHQTVGTGPFMLTDFVAGSVATLKRNPNYWQKDLVGPGKGNQLPYPDAVKILIIPDISTRLASMRTGKGDWIDGIESEDAKSLLKTNPEIQSYKYLIPALSVAMRIDKPELPYKDKRVRQALMMATDFEAFKRDLYGGQAEILAIPIRSSYSWIYTPLEKLPEAVQALFKYNPERAKQLLSEAGYPNGFKAGMIIRNVSSDMDSAAVFQAMWAKVGVNVELQPREAAVFANITNLRSQDDMLLLNAGEFGGAISSFYSSSTYRQVGAGRVDDKVINAALQEINKNIIMNFPKADQIIRELTPYILEQAYYIPRPSPYGYRLWQPWVKNYYGEGGIGSSTSAGAVAAPRLWLPFIWIDQDLKEKMTGRR